MARPFSHIPSPFHPVHMDTLVCELPLRDCQSLPPMHTCTLCHVALCHGCAVNQLECTHCSAWFCGQIECKEQYPSPGVPYCCPVCRDTSPSGGACSFCDSVIECGGCAQTCEIHDVTYCGDYYCDGYDYYSKSTAEWECPLCVGSENTTQARKRSRLDTAPTPDARAANAVT